MHSMASKPYLFEFWHQNNELIVWLCASSFCDKVARASVSDDIKFKQDL